MAYYGTGWKKRHTITIDHTKVTSGAHTNFPVLLYAGNFLADLYTNANADGSDLRFSSDIWGATPLAHELVYFTPGSSAAECWVKIPSLSGADDTVIYVWYNNPGATAPAADSTYGSQAVWSDYLGVLHLQSSIYDSKANSTAASTTTGTVTSTGCKIGSGYNFNGASRITTNAGTSYQPQTQTYTMSCWFQKDRNGSDEFPFSVGVGPTTGFYNQNADNHLACISQHATDAMTIVGVTDMTTAVWYRLAGRFDGTNFDNFTGKTKATTAAYSGKTLAANVQTFAIGANPGGTWPLDGRVDEIRFRASVLSDGWLDTEYDNQDAPNTFSTGSAATVIPQGGAFLLNMLG
jgi:hypothetical protein